MNCNKKGNIRVKSILIIGTFTLLLVLLLSILFVSPDIFKNIKMSIYNEDTHLSSPGSIPWWVGECRDDTHECEQLKKITFSNVIYVDDDWKITSSKRDWYQKFDYCKDVVEQKPPTKQSSYENYFHRPHTRYTTYDSCVMNYNMSSEIVDKNGCTIKTWTWYDGVLNRYYNVISPWSRQKCWYKDKMTRTMYYWSNDNKNAKACSHSSGGSELAWIWDCYQNINIYYKNELIGSVEQPDSGGFLVDIDNKIIYDDYNTDFVNNTKNFIRIRKVKSKYKGEPYYTCDYFLNEIIWSHRECLNNSECNDNNSYTLFDTCETYRCKHSEPVECLTDIDCDDNNEYTLDDKCIDYKCIISEPVECLNDSDCDDQDPYTLDDKCVDYKCIISGQIQCLSDSDCNISRECVDNACVMRYEYKDNDRDGILNKDDECIDLYGSDDKGCPTTTEKIVNYINKIAYKIWSFIVLRT